MIYLLGIATAFLIVTALYGPEKNNVSGVLGNSFKVVFGDISILKQPPADLQKLQANLTAVLEAREGTYSLYIRELPDGQVLTINSEEIYFGASLVKVPLAAAVMKDISDGAYSLNTEVLFEPQYYISGGNTFSESNFGKAYTIDFLLNRLLKDSDNTAQNILLSKIQNNLAFSLIPDQEQVTVQEGAQVFERLHSGSILDKDSWNYIYKLMLKTDFDDRIHLGLPLTAEFSHKIGNWPETGTWHDCGILSARGKDVIICLMSKDTSFSDFTSVAREVGKQTYEAFH